MTVYILDKNNDRNGNPCYTIYTPKYNGAGNKKAGLRKVKANRIRCHYKMTSYSIDTDLRRAFKGTYSVSIVKTY